MGLFVQTTSTQRVNRHHIHRSSQSHNSSNMRDNRTSSEICFVILVICTPIFSRQICSQLSKQIVARINISSNTFLFWFDIDIYPTSDLSILRTVREGECCARRAVKCDDNCYSFVWVAFDGSSYSNDSFSQCFICATCSNSRVRIN